MKKSDLRNFDPLAVAEADAAMWRSYYNHQFIKLFWQLFKVLRSQLKMSWLVTCRLAFYAGWAAADYRINRQNVNEKRVLKNLVKFYKLISTHSVKSFDYFRTAELELEWWNIHRKSTSSNPELESSLARAAAQMYNVKPGGLNTYARYRAEAMILPRHRGDSEENVIDWHQVSDLLKASWQSLNDQVKPRNSKGTI